MNIWLITQVGVGFKLLGAVEERHVAMAMINEQIKKTHPGCIPTVETNGHAAIIISLRRPDGEQIDEKWLAELHEVKRSNLPMGTRIVARAIEKARELTPEDESSQEVFVSTVRNNYVGLAKIESDGTVTVYTRTNRAKPEYGHDKVGTGLNPEHIHEAGPIADKRFVGNS